MTNEEYIKAIDMRTSRRTYKARALDKSILEVLKNMVDAVNEASGLEFQLVEDGTPAFKIFSGRFSYIAVCGEDSEAARIKSGYWGESIVLQCVYHGLGTCWVSGTYDENKVYKAIDLPKKHRLYAVIVVGYVKDKLSAKEKEVELIKTSGGKIASLGPRILRTQTAPVAGIETATFVLPL